MQGSVEGGCANMLGLVVFSAGELLLCSAHSGQPAGSCAATSSCSFPSSPKSYPFPISRARKKVGSCGGEMGCGRHDSEGEIQCFCSCGLGSCPATPGRGRLSSFWLPPPPMPLLTSFGGWKRSTWGQRTGAPPAPACEQQE